MAMEEDLDSKEDQGEIHFQVSTPEGMLDQVHDSVLLDKLLIEFEDLFMDLKTLPPTQEFDHAINLKSNLEPINIRSYSYPPVQKSVIEKMVREMVQQSFIKPSHSPFAYHVLLVKKKDGS